MSDVIPTIGRRVLLALGANSKGSWGPPMETMRRTIAELEAAAIRVQCISALYETAPVGPGRQPRYLNAVVVACADHAPARLLTILKRMERRAGRRPVRRGGSRPLDIDIIDFGGRAIGWPPARRRAPLVLPHPEAHRRAFVLVPLLDVCPTWGHPQLKISARRLLARLPRSPADVRPKLDSTWVSCEEGAQCSVAG